MADFLRKTRIPAAVLVCALCVLPSACSSTQNQSDDDKLTMPETSSNFEGEHYADVVTRLESSGFTNITTRKQEDLITGWLTKDGETESVSVNGRTDFSTTDEFDRDAKIVVTYHTFPSDDTEDEDVKNDETNSSSEEKEEVQRNDKHESDEDKKTVSSQETATQDKAAMETITVSNNPDLAALLNGSDSGPEVKSFAEKYRGRTIEFDGYTAAVQPHEGYNTRFDYLILAGDNGSAKGPSFRFTNVNYADLHLSDDAPDTFGVGLNIHVKAKVLEYDSSTTWFELEPVEISMR